MLGLLARQLRFGSHVARTRKSGAKYKGAGNYPERLQEPGSGFRSDTIPTLARVAPLPVFILAGALIGSLTGLFGVGGSSIATPILALLGVPPIVAIASPLPATIPSAGVAVIPYVRAKETRPRAAAWTVVGGLPGAIVGAYASKLVGGPTLLILSGVALVAVGARVIQGVDPAMRVRGGQRRRRRGLLVGVAAVIGFLTGLLANGGGFLLVPAYMLLFGLRMRQAAGTSLLVVVVLAIPTLLVHWSLGHIDWAVAAAFALGAVPMAAVAGRFAHVVEGPQILVPLSACNHGVGMGSPAQASQSL